MTSSANASDLKRRLEHARRRQREVAQGRVQDESGVRPLEREPSQSSVEAKAPLPVAESEPKAAPPLAPMSRRRLPWRAVLLLLAGGLIGAWSARLSPSVPAAALAPQAVVARPSARPPMTSRALAEPRQVAWVLHDGLNLQSNPAGAEVVAHGAVIANTPARVPRPTYPALYLLRRSGYHPQLVRVLPQSGDVVVDLRPLSEEQPGPSSAQGPRTKRKPDRGRGHDVGRQPAPGRSDGLVVGSSAR